MGGSQPSCTPGTVTIPSYLEPASPHAASSGASLTFGLGGGTLEYRAFSAATQSAATCQVRVIVVDLTGPVITCPKLQASAGG